MLRQYLLDASGLSLTKSGQVLASCAMNISLLKVQIALTKANGMASAILIFQELSSSTDWRFDVVRKSACIMNCKHG
jgi:hypothetical protein